NCVGTLGSFLDPSVPFFIGQLSKRLIIISNKPKNHPLHFAQCKLGDFSIPWTLQTFDFMDFMD
ncbi:hypothetical protein COZ63_00535, partial [Candidatus Berkelbacteria bacterium CG_4_8_14_3_um_filter_42_13]